nr:MAG TPA: terminase small subunit [Caudoviricetes sp.]
MGGYIRYTQSRKPKGPERLAVHIAYTQYTHYTQPSSHLNGPARRCKIYSDRRGGIFLPYIKFNNAIQRKRYWLGEDGIELINDWRRRGLSVKAIAEDKIGVAHTTLMKWRQQSPELDKALTITEDLVDGQVEGALLKRALGYDYFEETWTLDPDTGREVLTRKVKKHVPADVKAIAMWLFNRRGDAWRSMQPQLPADDGDIIDVKNVLVQIEEAADGDKADA